MALVVAGEDGAVGGWVPRGKGAGEARRDTLVFWVRGHTTEGR